MLESFLNGLIIFKRGRQTPKPGQPERPAYTIKSDGSVNNVLLKKLKVALSLTSEDILEILEDVGVIVSKGELTAIFRKEGHKHYMECGDKYARNFLKGLAKRYRSWINSKLSNEAAFSYAKIIIEMINTRLPSEKNAH